MLDSTGHLAIALLSIYSIYTPQIFYLLWKHGKHGLLAWIYLLAFSTLRITGSILIITDEHKNKNSSSASIINSIALSPLILTSFGILHEANHTIHGTTPRLLSWPLRVLVHLLSYSGIALAATGGKSLTTSNKSSTAAGELKGGIIIFASLWLLLVALSFQSMRYKRTVRESQWLLYALLTTLPFLGVRVAYSLITAFSTSRALNPVTGSITAKVLLGSLPELLVTTIFVVAGILTRNVARKENESYGRSASREGGQSGVENGIQMIGGGNQRGKGARGAGQ